jgi:hypothetical protein
MVLLNSICSLAMIFPLLLVADGTAPLEIRVVDPQGNLPGATIKLLPPGSEAEALLTDAEGRAKYAALPCDRLHSIEVSCPGYATLQVTEIDVCDAAPILLTICLDDGIICSLPVSNCLPLVDVSKMRVSTVYTPQFLQDLPGSRGTPSKRPSRRKDKKEYRSCEQAVAVTSSSSTP